MNFTANRLPPGNRTTEKLSPGSKPCTLTFVEERFVPAGTSHCLTVLSFCAAVSTAPSGERTIQKMLLVWSRSFFFSRRATSHTRTELSRLPVYRVLPSGEKTRDVTLAVCSL